MIIVSLKIDFPFLGSKQIIEIKEIINFDKKKEYVSSYDRNTHLSEGSKKRSKIISKKRMNNLFKLMTESKISPVPEPDDWLDTTIYELSFYNNSYKYVWMDPDPISWKPLQIIADRVEKWAKEK
ncbi:MAG: hypothetical protein N2A97_03930 [Thermodesulfobacteriales bacterium]